MRTKSKLMAFMLILISLFLLSIEIFPSIFFTYPGARARSMGGAFAAVANDCSAIWYNPAGIPNHQTDIVIEGNQTAIRLSSKNKTVNSNNIQNAVDGFDPTYTAINNGVFVGASFGGFAIAYYQPYVLDAYFSPYRKGKAEMGDPFGYYRENIRLISLGGAISSDDDDFLRLGLSIDFILLNFSEREFNIWQYAPKTFGRATYVSTSQIFLASSVGFLSTVLKNNTKTFKLNIGGVYRSSSWAEIFIDDMDKFLNQLAFNRPASWDLGISATLSTFTIAIQYGRTYWATMDRSFKRNYITISVGGEYQCFLGGDVVMALRAGWCNSQPSIKDSLWPWEKNATVGIGFRFTKSLGIEFTYMNRNSAAANLKKSLRHLLALAITATWESNNEE